MGQIGERLSGCGSNVSGKGIPKVPTEIDLTDVVTDVGRAFADYEKALTPNDVENGKP